VCLWRPDSETRPRTMPAHQGSANAVALPPRGDLLVTAGGVERGNFSILVWDIATGRPVRALAGHSDWPLWVAFSRDADLLASGSYGEICLWDARSLQRSPFHSRRIPAPS
jgi:WD40 repeat protein